MLVGGSDTRVPRPTLQELFQAAGQRRVCVVIGAAGWGKSTAIGSWPLAKAWVTCEGHTGAAKFVAEVLAALAEHVPLPEGDADPAEEPSPDAHAARVCRWLRAVLDEDLLLVIDDVHELAPDSGAAGVVEGLCRHAPPQLRVVLVSRRELPFSLTRLRGQGLVTEIHAPELAFGLDEVAVLLQGELGESAPELVRQVWEQTAGWPTAVRSAIELLRGVPDEERVAVLDRMVSPGERFHGYLLEQVVEPESERVLRLLRWLAVFGSANGWTSTASGISDAPLLLADLGRRGLVRRVPGRPDRWSLVRPLRDYFEQEPELTAQERAELHRTAALAFAQRGRYAQALRHAVAAGDHETVCALLLEHGENLVNAGRAADVLAAAGGPAECLDDPRIQRVFGHARQVRGDWSRALECFRRAARDRPVLEPALAWRVAFTAYMQADFDEVLAVADRTEPGDGPDSARLLILVGITRRMVGDYERASQNVNAAVAIAQACGEPSAMAAAHTGLAALASMAGDRRSAEAHCVSALEAAQADDDVLQVLQVRIMRSATLRELGLLKEALAEAELAVELGEQCEEAFLTAHALTARGAVQVRLGGLEPALADFVAARDLFQRIASRFLSWPLGGMGDVYRMRGQLARARAAYEEALALAEPHNEVLGLGTALSGLARVRAADDLAVARELVDRAVALDEGMRIVEALLARGWVALQAGERAMAAEDATRAAAAARTRRDDPGLAEALVLGSLCVPDQAWRHRALNEAIQICRETGCRVQEAVAMLVASRAGVTTADVDGEFAFETLRARGIDLRAPRPAGPLAVLAGTAAWVSIRALGVFQVIRDGVPVPRTDWRSRKARQLLKIIVAKRRPVTRDQLMELLWPEADPTRAGNRLSVLLSVLRDVLQPGSSQLDSGPLVTDGSVVWLDLTLVDVDVERFLSHANAALDAHRHGREDAMAQLVAAEAAYAGDFLEDDPYQEWAAPLAEETRATHVALLRALVLLLRNQGEVDQVVRYSLRLLDKDKYDEQAHLELVEVLLDAGRHGEARRRYSMYVTAMAELGVEPWPFKVRYRGRRRTPR